MLAAAVLAVVCISPASAKNANPFTSFPEDVPASVLEFAAPDDTAFRAAADALDAAVKAGTASNKAFSSLYDTMYSARNRLDTVGSICEIYYNRDPDSYRKEYLSWCAMYERDSSRQIEISRAALASKYKDTIREMLGEQQADSILAQTPDTQAQLDLLSQCDTLVDDYWTGMNAAYTASIDGRTYTYEQLSQAYNSGALDYDPYIGGYARIEQQKNAVVAPILASLVKLRNEYAVSKGYQNYTEYAYPNVYGRDFTTKDAKTLESYVKKYIVPVKKMCSKIQSYNGDLSEDRLSALDNLSQQQILDKVRPYMSGVSEEYAKLFSYMERNRLCDIGPSDQKLAASFTDPLSSYDSAYIFIGSNGESEEITSLVHEFGHFAQFCLDNQAAGSFDVAEINSQGLVALYLKYADGLAGKGGGDALRAYVEYDLVGSIVDGCLYDEFQQKLYENGNMTSNEINRLYRSLAEEYGIIFATDSDEAYNWIEVDHTFESPLYYISYATSACTALELLSMSMNSCDAAADKYLQLTADSGDYSYRALIKKEGLTDIFSAGGVKKIADGALRYMEKEAADVPDYTDLSGHWFADGANLLSAAGLMQGSGTNFAPDAKTTRAMFVSVLYRIFGTDDAAAGSPAFSDVQDASAWYYNAVSWAAENGYVKGSRGCFHPGDPITRQDMAVILARTIADEDTAADAHVLDTYSDSTSISGYARNAVAIVTEEGLMKGSGGKFDPMDDATRAEMGQTMLRVIK